ncbi:MAG: GGDEF domain-containing protein [Microthrixaceae bacterium]
MTQQGPDPTTRRLMASLDFLRSRSERFFVAPTVLAMVSVVALDWWTGPEVNLSLGFALVTMFAAFGISPRSGLMASAFVAGWSWLIATSHPEATLPTSTVAVNVGLRLLFFVLLTIGAAALRSVVDELDRLAATDPLTGAWNRRALLSLLDREVAHGQRTGQPLSLVYLDLRLLKQVNDQFGHQAGDDMIRSLAQGLGKGLRRGDILARVGGDEFVVVLPDVEAPAAARLLRRILESPGVPRVNAGLVEFQPGAGGSSMDVQEMLRRADEAMYHAKANGLGVHSETCRSIERSQRPLTD